MNKKYLKSLIYIFIALLILGLSFYLFSVKTNLFNKKSTVNTTKDQPVDTMTKDEVTAAHLYHLGIYQVMARDETGKPISYRFIGVRMPEPISKDVATTAEKSKFNLASTTKIQVLKRDKNGKILDYRVMENDNDVTTVY